MRKIAVGDVMTHNFIAVDPETNLLRCAKDMVRNNINSLIIIERRVLKGIITSKDIMWAITKKPGLDLRKINAMDVATKKVAVIKPSADIGQAFEKMRKLGFRRLPVLSRGEVIGVITFHDILRIEPSLYREIGELVNLREEERKIRETETNWPTEGTCENCGEFKELLKVHDRLLCPDCREELF